MECNKGYTNIGLNNFEDVCKNCERSKCSVFCDLFVKKYCPCGSQRCEMTEEFIEGCKHYNPDSLFSDDFWNGRYVMTHDEKYKEVYNPTRVDHYFIDKSNYKYYYILIRRILMSEIESHIFFIHIPYIDTKNNYSSYITLYIDCVSLMDKLFNNLFDMSFLEDKEKFEEASKDTTNFVKI